MILCATRHYYPSVDLAEHETTAVIEIVGNLHSTPPRRLRKSDEEYNIEKEKRRKQLKITEYNIANIYLNWCWQSICFVTVILPTSTLKTIT